MGDRYGVLSREMTKLHEEFLRGNLSEILSNMQQRPNVKGECTLLVMGREEDEDVDMKTVRSDIKKGFKVPGSRPSDIAKGIAKKYKLPKNKVYKEVLKIKKSL
jgi:16S rRNA (cytidine1402-2'-O)-methyltransferase